jgi:nucleoprotein TPR
METKSKLTESSAIPLSYEVERTRKELDSLSAHSQWLNKELQERSDQLVAEKQKHSDQILEITQKLEAAVAERDEYQSTVAALKKSQSDLRTRTEELALKLREAEQEAINIKESSTQELQAKDRLVAAQQEQLDNRAREYNRLVHEKESLTELANQASQTTKREVDNVRLSLQEETQKIIEEQNERHLREVALLQSRLEDAVRRADQAEDRVMTSTRPRLAAPDRPLTLTQGDDEEPLGMTDLYDRLYQAQNALQKEQAEVRKLKLILQKIQAEIDAKTPQIRREREEGDFAKQQLQESRARLNAAFGELEAVRQELKETTLDKEELTKHNRELKQENTELAKQVQALLVSRAGGELDSEIPITVQQIQTQNQQLLQEHRRLSRTVEELEEKLQNDPLQIKHEQLEEELRTLREEQEKQEAAVSGIVEQRDLYRAIAFSQNSSLEVGNIDSVSSLAERNRQLAQRCTELETSLTKARSDLDSMVRDKETLEHRVARYETLTTELTSSNDRLQREISSAVASIARTESDAAYHRDRVGRLEELVDQARSEAQRAQESAYQMQTVNANLQKAVSAAKAEASKREQESLQVIIRWGHSYFRLPLNLLSHTLLPTQAGMKLRLAETQVETAKASELYLSNQVTQLRTEIARQGALLESVQRIENSISAKNEETKERLFEDYQRLQDELSTERSKHNLETENLSGRIRELEIDLKAANEKKDEALASELETKKQALVTSEKVHELKTKCSTLEAELRAAKKKLGVEDIDGEDMEVVLQAKVISLTADLEKAQEELKLAKESATKYQNFATTKEEENAELAKAFDLFKKQQQEEIEALRIKLEQTKKEAEPQQQLIIELTNDLANQRGEREKVVAELKAKVASLEAESESLRKDAEIAESRVASMSAEVAAYQADATTAQNNYESELMKHAAACSKLRAVQEDAEKDVLRRREAEERLEMVHMQIDEERKLMEEKKKALDKTVKDLEKSLEDARAQNDILHRQLASQGDELEKLQSERIDAATSNDAPGGETDSGAGAASLQKEVDLLRSQRSELREMLRYARSEHEATRAQVDAARHTAEREKATAAVTKHALDEARAELKVAQSSLASASESDGSRVKDLTDKLNAANEQVTLLSESNKLLREETDKMRATTSSLQDELATLKSNIVPKENKTRELESEKAALEAEKASLIRQLEDWEQRMRTVISSTNQVRSPRTNFHILLVWNEH